jgi:hypothetical protein
MAAVATSSMAVDEELHKMLVETSSNDKERRATDKVWWALMLDKTDKKL